MLIKRILLNCYHVFFYLIQTVFGIFKTARYFSNTIRKAFLIGTPEHDNLGDHAIALSETQFIEKYFPEYEIIEITVESWRWYRINLLRNVQKNDAFFITGGGNMGDVYTFDEKLRRFVISHFKDNLIVGFPQTILYTDSTSGKNELIKSQKIYNAHNRLILCAREEISYNLMKKYYPNATVYLCPDMVFNLRLPIENMEKDNSIGICLRRDCEGVLSQYEKNYIIKKASQKGEIKYFNTCLPHGIKPYEREKEITILFNQIAGFSLVITDRLHGAIFAIINKTPCIAFQGTSHKLLSTKRWLSKEMVMVDAISDFDKALATKVFDQYDKKNYSKYYESLAHTIRGKL